MAVEIEGHCDPAVPHDRLNAFGWPFEVGDEQTGRRVAQQVEVIAVLAGLVCQAAFSARSSSSLFRHVPECGDAVPGGR